MKNREYSSEDLFVQRLEEQAKVCSERYTPQFTHFLDGKSLRTALSFLERNASDVTVMAYGGFKDAERCVIGMFPKDIYADGSDCHEEMEELMNLKGLVIEGSGFSSFSHRDCMGSVLALGIKREAMGDIYVPKNGNCAYICLTEVAAEYLNANLDFVARDKVKTNIISACELPVPIREYSVISGTVASVRLDSVVALATKLSREKAKQIVNAGLVNVNHFEESRSDYTLDEGDILSIRGYGRFIVAELPGMTKKDRNKVIIHKMI